MQIQVRDLYKQKRSLETEWAVHQRDNQRYTLDMVRIDNKIREVVSAIKQEEAKIATLLANHLQTKIISINNFDTKTENISKWKKNRS